MHKKELVKILKDLPKSVSEFDVKLEPNCVVNKLENLHIFEDISLLRIVPGKSVVFQVKDKNYD